MVKSRQNSNGAKARSSRLSSSQKITISDLPTEVLILILSYLHPHILRKLERINRTWEHFIKYTSQLWIPRAKALNEFINFDELKLRVTNITPVDCLNLRVAVCANTSCVSHGAGITKAQYASERCYMTLAKKKKPLSPHHVVYMTATEPMKDHRFRQDVTVTPLKMHGRLAILVRAKLASCWSTHRLTLIDFNTNERLFTTEVQHTTKWEHIANTNLFIEYSEDDYGLNGQSLFLHRLERCSKSQKDNMVLVDPQPSWPEMKTNVFRALEAKLSGRRVMIHVKPAFPSTNERQSFLFEVSHDSSTLIPLQNFNKLAWAKHSLGAACRILYIEEFSTKSVLNFSTSYFQNYIMEVDDYYVPRYFTEPTERALEIQESFKKRHRRCDLMVSDTAKCRSTIGPGMYFFRVYKRNLERFAIAVDFNKKMTYTFECSDLPYVSRGRICIVVVSEVTSCDGKYSLQATYVGIEISKYERGVDNSANNK